MVKNIYILVGLVAVVTMVFLYFFGNAIIRFVRQYFCGNKIIFASSTDLRNAKTSFSDDSESSVTIFKSPMYTGSSQSKQRKNENKNVPSEGLCLPVFLPFLLPKSLGSCSKRLIVIDGCSIFAGPGEPSKFSPKHVELCLKYFTDLGHSPIAVVLHELKYQHEDGDILQRLMEKQQLYFAPKNDEIFKWPAPFNHLMMFLIAGSNNALIVSNADFTSITKNCLKHYPSWQGIANNVIQVKWNEEMLELSDNCQELLENV